MKIFRAKLRESFRWSLILEKVQVIEMGVGMINLSRNGSKKKQF